MKRIRNSPRSLTLRIVVSLIALPVLVGAAWVAAQDSSPTSERYRKKIENEVRSAFDARQESLRQEIAEFRERLDRLERTLDDREQAKEKIVERRVEELLDPNLQWDPANEAGSSGVPMSPVPSVSTPPHTDGGHEFSRLATRGDDVSELEGVWVNQYAPLEFVISGNSMAFFNGNKVLRLSRFTTNAEVTPKRIWIETVGEQPTRGIYEVDGDRLRMSTAFVDDSFPTEFTPANGQFKRVSAKPSVKYVEAMRKAWTLQKENELPESAPDLSSPAKEQKLEGDLALWQGKWRLVRAEHNGKPVSEEKAIFGLKEFEVIGTTVRLGDTIAAKLIEEGWPESSTRGDIRRLKPIPSWGSAGEFVVPMRGQGMVFGDYFPMNGIYRFRDGKLELCFHTLGFYNPDRKPLYYDDWSTPNEFETTPNSERHLYVLEKVEGDDSTQGKSAAASDDIRDKWSMELKPVGEDAVAADSDGSSRPYKGGLRVTEVFERGLAEKAGLKFGDIILGAGAWETLTLEHFLFALRRSPEAKRETPATGVELRALRGETVIKLVLDREERK